MRRSNLKWILKRSIFFMSLLFLTFIFARMFFLVNHTIFANEIKARAKIINETRRNHLALDRMHIGVPTGSLDDVKLPPFVESHDVNGPGENGVPVNISKKNLKSEENKARYDKGWVRHTFNEYVSDMISIHRSLPDCRSYICRQQTDNFNGTLPELSVIFIFYNEAWTTLLRSVHSVINRTPAHILKEIILVDDNSTFDYLQAPLDKYFSTFPKVKVIHSTERNGLIRARLMGFEASSAPVVVFLDSHIECFSGWAEPMLIRISRNPNAVVFPLIPTINSDTFGFQCAGRPYYYCGFNWRFLQLEWIPIPKREWDRRKDDADTIWSPTMPGGLFAVSREFFQKLGTYDPGLEYWGGENMELSFKTWMCGGSLEMDPCSMVGHVYRKKNPNSGQFPPQLLKRNAVRVAEVWMDDYKNYHYERINYNRVDPGDITDRRHLRASLQCNSFQWYLRNVYPEQTYPHGIKYAGAIKSAMNSRCITNLFIASIQVNRPVLQACNQPNLYQIWYMDAAAQINQDDIFLCVGNGTAVLLKTNCHQSSPQWEYKEEKWLYHKPTGLCLTAAGDNYMSITPCTNSTWQMWDFQRRRLDLTFPA